LSFRTVADRMGGSTTLVTHYFPTRQALLDALAEMVSEWPEELSALEAGTDDPRVRLRLFLRWMVPHDADGHMTESGRINLIGERDAQLRTRHLFDTWDRRVRELLRDHVDGLVPGDRVEPTVDLLRTITNGLTLSAVEHPDKWPAERQFAVLDDALEVLGLMPSVAVEG
jgi:AcrR family transcriptional regulator